MAKRKRLSPAGIAAPDPAAPETKSMGSYPLGVQPVSTRRPPIAQVAGDAAAQAALEEVAGELSAARASGRMVLELALNMVDAGYLVRDRMQAEEGDLAELMASLKARGQQTPIEVAALENGRYGLISGWRRLSALRRLHGLDGQGGFATVQALLRRPERASDAYLAMVEENEIRVGLSFYERARIVARAAEQGVYPNQAAALKGLFGGVSRAKRSKIGSFLKLYHHLDDRLRFAFALSERLGLALVRALESDPVLAPNLRERLRKTVAESPADEVAFLERWLVEIGQKQSLTLNKADPNAGKIAREHSGRDQVGPGVFLQGGAGRLVLSGPGVTPGLEEGLRVWLAGLAGQGRR